MANIDGAGSGVFPALRMTAAGAAAQYIALNQAPVDGNRVPTTAVTLKVDVSNTGGTNSDVDFDVATDAAFTNIVWGPVVLNVPNGVLTVQASGLVDGTKYYWRARVAPTGTTTWGPWSGTSSSTNPPLPVSSATALSVFNNDPVNAAAKAVDNDMSTWWHSAGEMPTWWQAQFATAKVITSLTLRIRPWTVQQTPRDFLIQGSNDGTTWTTLSTQTGITYTAGAIDEPRTYSWANSTAYLYARIYVTASNGSNYQNFAEVVISETGGTPVVTVAPWTFLPDLNSGRGFGYVNLNAGFEPVLDPDVTAVGYVDENVGFEPILDRDVTAAAYVDENIGVEITKKSDAVEPVYEGDVNTLTPTPHLWFLKPKSGRPGDGIRVFCFGVGDLQSTFAGVVEAYMGPSAGWVTVPVIGWQTYPPTSHAYDALRQLDELSEIIDMQHTVVEITVPLTALPPGLPLRIRTNGA